MDAILEVRNAHYTYPGGVEALRGVSLKVHRGRIVSILGPNGAGKTTLLLICAGLLKPNRGEVLFDGENIELVPGIRKRIGIVFQDPDDQLFNITVYDEIAFGLKQLGLNREEIDEKVHEITERLGIRRLLGRSPFTLSYGEKKLVVLASILVLDPELLILDEPTANLSRQYRERIISIIREYKKKQRGVLIATHDELLALEVSDYLYVLNNGEIITHGKPEEVLLMEDKLEKAGLMPLQEIILRIKRITGEISS